MTTAVKSLKAKKATTPRKKKLPTLFSTPVGDFDNVGIGLADDYKTFSYVVNSPVFIPSYHVNNTDNLRRLLIAHYGSLEGVSLFVADFSRELGELKGSAQDQIDNSSSSREDIKGLLTEALEASVSGQVALVITDTVKLIKGDEEAAELLRKMFEASKSSANLNVFAFAHASSLREVEQDILNSIFEPLSDVMVVGNILQSDYRMIFGEKKLANLFKVEHNENAVYDFSSLKRSIFKIYTTPVTWFIKKDEK